MTTDGPAATEPSATPATSPSSGEAAPVGIASAFERVMARFESLARAAARARRLPPDEMDEVLQDVRIRLWKLQATSEKLDSIGASYLMRVVSSAVIDRLRRRQRQREVPLDAALKSDAVPVPLQVAPHDYGEQQALALRFERALSQMPQNRRVVVQLHLEGYTRPEIAGMTGWTEDKVRNLLYRGLDDLRTKLRNDGANSDG